MNDLISEFFIDIITRVIPGFVVLALYPTTFFTKVFNEISDSPALSIPCLIGEAWVIGFTIERATFLLGLLFRRIIKVKAKEENGFLKNLTEVNKPDDCFPTDNFDKRVTKSFDFFKFTRRHGMKLSGERIFCRVMCAISLGTCIISLICICNRNSTFFGDGKCPLIYFVFSLLGTIIFGAAWFSSAWSCYQQNRKHPKFQVGAAWFWAAWSWYQRNKNHSTSQNSSKPK